MYDYSKLESKIDIMVQHLATYIHDYDSAYIKNEIFRAYEYARDAHE
ncbi:MAG: hypothetical protein H6767_02965 [Candidatus Peribacteria bacterium]|nr:MAG: hypothetical protein H6767_02965 [Candidatus Peribacteria bacterium]